MQGYDSFKHFTSQRKQNCINCKNCYELSDGKYRCFGSKHLTDDIMTNPIASKRVCDEYNER